MVVLEASESNASRHGEPLRRGRLLHSFQGYVRSMTLGRDGSLHADGLFVVAWLPAPTLHDRAPNEFQWSQTQTRVSCRVDHEICPRPLNARRRIVQGFFSAAERTNEVRGKRNKGTFERFDVNCSPDSQSEFVVEKEIIKMTRLYRDAKGGERSKGEQGGCRWLRG